MSNKVNPIITLEGPTPEEFGSGFEAAQKIQDMKKGEPAVHAEAQVIPVEETPQSTPEINSAA